MAKRPYTGWDRNARSKRAGTQKLIELLNKHSNGGLWNNGSWVVRPMRGKKNPSVHGTGRAFDMSWRGGKYGGYGDYEKAKKWVEFLTQHADALEIEAIFDYWPEPYGTGYRCDRDYTRVYTKRAFSGAPNGDWIHIEVSNRFADDPDAYEEIFEYLLSGDIATGIPKVTESMPDNPTMEDYPGKPLKVGSRGDAVQAVQAKVGAVSDGDFGPKTEASVKKWQAANGLTADGVVGPVTWEAMFDSEDSDKPEYPGSSLKKGSKGDAVKLIQAKIDAYVDGDFGPKTEKAVKAWQSANGLLADGIVGPKTWGRMFG